MSNLGIKKGFENRSLISQKSNLWNYFSWWIANLGVVPWFLFAAFLLVPIFFFLFALLFLVTLVLETISMLLYLKLKIFDVIYNSKDIFLPNSRPCVKEFLIFPIVLVFFTGASNVSASNYVDQKKELLLSKGEVRELKVAGLRKFTVSNPEVAALKHIKASASVLIKAKSMGLSEIILWTSKDKIRLQVFVQSKRSQMKLLSKKKALEKIGLSGYFFSGKLVVEGEIKSTKELILVNTLIDEKENNILFETTISLELKKEIYSKAYLLFYKEYGPDIYCKTSKYQIHCYYDESYQISKEEIQKIEAEIPIKLSKRKVTPRNYKLIFKILQISTHNEKNRSLGLDQLNFKIKDVFSPSFDQLLKSNELILKDKNIHIQTLATPTTVLKINKKAQVQLGSEIPYTVTSNDQIQTEWKFAGLKINVKLSKDSKAFTLDTESELTGPGDNGQVNGSKQMNSFFIRPEIPITIYDVGMEVEIDEDGNLPGLGSIPILGTPFSSNHNSKTYKKIIAIAVLKEMHNE